MSFRRQVLLHYYAMNLLICPKIKRTILIFTVQGGSVKKNQRILSVSYVLVSKGATIIVSFATLFAILLFELRYLKKALKTFE